MILGVCNWLSYESKINVVIIRLTFVLSLIFLETHQFLIYFSIYFLMKYFYENNVNWLKWIARSKVN